MEDKIKSAFILSALNTYGIKATRAVKREILKLKVEDTQSLFKSVAYRSQAGNDSHQGKLELIFNEYGRMVDMGVGKGNALGDNRLKRIEKLTVKGKRKPRKFYSPTVYGLLNPLINELQYGYTESIKQQLKLSLENSSS